MKGPALGSPGVRLSHVAIGFGALVILAIITLAVGSALVLRESEIATWRAQLGNLSLAVTEQTYQKLSSATLAMDSIVARIDTMRLADTAALRGRAGSADVHSLLRERIEGLPHVDVATIVAANGDVINFTRAYPPPPINLADRDYFLEQAKKSSTGNVISQPVRNRGTGKWTFYLSRRLSDVSGNFMGLVLVGISVDAIANFHERLGRNLGEGASVTLLRDDYMVLARWPANDELIGRHNKSGTSYMVVTTLGRTDDVVYSASGRFAIEPTAPIPRLAAVRIVDRYPLIVNITVTERLFLAGWRRFVSVIAAMAIVATATLLLGLYFLVRMLQRREVYETQIREHAAELDSIAHYDTLTGLPNRRLLAELLAAGIARNAQAGRSIAVCYMDIDGFKAINDRHGHAAGDRMLVNLARRLEAVLREGDTLARLGGDEFIILVTDLMHPQQCYEMLDRVLAAVEAPLRIGEAEIRITGSIGVSLSPPDAGDADTLLRHADQAMYRAKEAGKNRYHIFDPEIDRQVKAHHHRTQRIRAALENEEFVLLYQPKVDMLTGEVVGVEALLRWMHPESGLLLPGEFLYEIQGSNLEIAIGQWVIVAVLRQLAAWQAAGLPLVASANVAAGHLLQPDFAGTLRQALDAHPEVPPARFELEIVETAALTDMDRAVHTIDACRAFGIRIALDDFGTGYSSLANFRTLQVDVLKIDRSFVRDMLDDPSDLEIVESIVRLAHAFEREVIAEGVESPEHGRMLLRIGCRLGQGYGIGVPMPASELPAWLKRWAVDASWVALRERPAAAMGVSALVV